MTLSMKQLWDERERFLKFERGWGGLSEAGESDDLENEEDGESDSSQKSPGNDDILKDRESRRRLHVVEEFYVSFLTRTAIATHTNDFLQRDALTHLQSFVIVLLKVVLANVTALVTAQNALHHQNGGLAAGFQENSNVNGFGKGKGPNGNANGRESPAVDELDAARNREITAKAVSGILLLVLKWFRVSRECSNSWCTRRVS